MKKLLAILSVIFILSSSIAFAAGGQNHGSKGQGSTGSDGQGSTTQTRGN